MCLDLAHAFMSVLEKRLIEFRVERAGACLQRDLILQRADLAFAAFTGLWLMPRGYGGGKADHVRIEREQAPAAMQADIERWIEAFPQTTTWVETLYESR